jgi:Abnormal spindle-like microcephaly-assoc'd, ASPM-SPD-2-Hydin
MQRPSLQPALRLPSIFLICLSLGALLESPAQAQKFTVTPSSITFDNETVGLQSTSQVVEVKNVGKTPVTVNSFTLSPFAVFQLDYGYAPQTLLEGQGASFAIKFVPGLAQEFTGQMTISIAGQSEPSIVSLKGTGILTEAKALVSPAVINFANQNLGITKSQTITVKNIGSSPMTLTSVAAEPPFSISGYTTTVEIDPQKSFSFQVGFTPVAEIPYTNTLSMTFDVVPDQSVSLSGTGILNTSKSSTTPLASTTFPTLPAGTQDSAYLAALTAIGGNAPLTWSLSTGSKLPAGLTLSSEGSITGTLASSVNADDYSFTTEVRDSSVPPQTLTLPLVLPVGAATGAKCDEITWDIAGTHDLLVPLTQLGTGTYFGAEGGLYPNGSNTMPPAQNTAGVNLANSIQPLNAEGDPDPNGVYVMLSIGVSITHTIFDQFVANENSDPEKNSHLVFVNGAIDGSDGPDWISPESGTWLSILNNFLPYQNVTANQVVAAWVMMPHSNNTGTFPEDMGPQETDLIAVLQDLHTLFPNLKLAYVNGMQYGGYSNPPNLEGVPTYPEPYAYESGFAVQSVIANQIDGNADLNFNPLNGPVMAPWLSWGPYNWANGMSASNNGLNWPCQDYASDGLHPSVPAGRNAYAGLLVTFFKTDNTTTPWFLAPQ